MVNEEQMETLHLFVVPDNQMPPRLDYLGISIATLCSLVLVGMIGLILFSPKAEPVVSFTTTIAGFRLPTVSKTITLTIHATGKGHVNATYATGSIVFYNGQIYTQIIPTGTVLQGVDGVLVITDAQAVIPPAAQTTPPTYGQVRVPAHALQAGTSGNIAAGDINQACCVTSVIAQNPYNFTGGSNARNFTYLTHQDVTSATTSHLEALKHDTLTLFTSSPVVEPMCASTSTSSPIVGKETLTARLTLAVSCTAISFSKALAKNRIVAVGRSFGQLSHIQFDIVGISEKKGVVMLRLYVTATVTPIVYARFGDR